MKKINAILLSGLLLAAAAPVMAQDESPVSSKGRNRIAEIEAFEAQLDNLFTVAQKEGASAASPIYVQARGHLREAASIINKKPASKDAGAVFSVCSVSATAALKQLESEINRAKVRQLGVARDSLLFVLHKLHETINRIEGSKANALSQELEAQKAQASMLQGDLEATKAQASLLREDLAAERERARKIMEDAQKRFAELQSSVLSVSRDARGTIISMADILFATGKADLQPTLKENLAKIAGILIVYKDPKLVVEGHTDSTGSKELNQKLSEDRAANVKNYLIEQGVASERLTSIGRGKDKPIADNKTKEGQAKNRRVELIIQDNPEGAAVAPPPPPAPVAVPAPAPAQVAPTKTAPTQVAPTQAAPTQTAPVQTTPAQTAPVQTTPAKTTPAQTAPVQTTPAQTAPVQTTPAKTAPAQTAPAQTAPAKTAPAQTAPVQTAPAQTAPAQTAPAQATPAKAAPAPAKGN